MGWDRPYYRPFKMRDDDHSGRKEPLGFVRVILMLARILEISSRGQINHRWSIFCVLILEIRRKEVPFFRPWRRSPRRSPRRPGQTQKAPLLVVEEGRRVLEANPSH